VTDRPRILLHPGFHKTGTSSIQHFLWSNRAALAPHAQLRLLRHLKEPARLCMAASRSHDPLVLLDLADALFAALDGIDPARPLILSCEGLSGHLPGWPGVDSYAAAPITLAYVAGFLADWAPEADLQVLLTLRDPDAWLHSAWRHHLMGQRLTLDWPAFQQRYAPAADLTAMADEIGEALDGLPVTTLDLAQMTGHSHGPGGALLTAFGLPEPALAAFTPVGRDNPGPDSDLSARFLALNLSDLPDADLRAEKARLADDHGVGGWIRP